MRHSVLLAPLKAHLGPRREHPSLRLLLSGLLIHPLNPSMENVSKAKFKCIFMYCHFNLVCIQTTMDMDTPVTPALQKWRQEEQEFKVSFSCAVSWKLAWAP